ncbi:SipW-dependent-type signal peptide-containing protein [Candidatus Pacebacteria bacterium]|nr:SipW-dependent-type signal peptide-containing protein [Candidatus Paceibacterota bacterium]
MKITIIKSSLILFALAAIAGVGYTTSFFQDIETSAENTFEAGSLDLVINEPADAVWVAENWLPGDEIEGEIDLENVGSIPISSLIMEVEVENN